MWSLGRVEGRKVRSDVFCFLILEVEEVLVECDENKYEEEKE